MRFEWTRIKRWLPGVAVSVILSAYTVGFAEGVPNQVTAVQISPAGDLIFEVQGEGFDPLLSSRALPGGQYEITIRGQGISLQPVAMSQVSQALKGQIPALIESQFQSQANGFVLRLTSWQRLQPQVDSNSGHQVVITLVGVRALPKAVVARQAAEAKRQDAQKLAQAQQQEVQKKRTRKMLAESAIRLPSRPVGREAIEADWQTAYQAIDEDSPLKADLSAPAQKTKPVFLNFPRTLNDPLRPQALANDPLPQSQPASIQPPSMGDPDDSDAIPANPLRLQSLPNRVQPPAVSRSTGEGTAQPDAGGNFSEYAQLSQPALERARQAMQNGQPDQAELELRHYLESNEHDARARYLLAQVILSPLHEDASGNRSRRESARQELLKAVSQKPFLPAYVSLIDLYLGDLNFSDAARLLQSVLPLYSTSAPLWFEQGRLNEGLNELNAAESAYKQALAYNPQYSEAHYRLAQVALKVGHLEQCRWELGQVLALVPDDSRCWKLLAYLAEKRGKPEKAETLYKAALQPDVMLKDAALLAAQNQTRQALSLYAAVEAIAEDDADILLNLTLGYARLKNAARAESTFKRLNKAVHNPQDERIKQASAALKALGQ